MNKKNIFPTVATAVLAIAIAACPPAFAQNAPERESVEHTLVYTNDVLANVSGGTRRGAIDQGKLEATLRLDLERAAGLKGLSFYTNAFAAHNTGRIRRDYVGGMNTIAAIEAVTKVRLSELWLEQRFADDAASVRVGQLAADVEFFYSGLSMMFLQSDWPTIAAVNLPSGGPAYPLSTPGARLKINFGEDASWLTAVFNGDPAGPGAGDEQLRNRHGLNFRTSDSRLLMTEAQLRANQGPKDTGLARTLKFGGWYHTGTFEDRRRADDGRLLADPAGSGTAQRHRGNWSLYAVIDQQLRRPAGGDAESGLSTFGRIAISPDDRNLVGFYLDGGLTLAGPFDGREKDRLGLGFMLARFSGDSRRFDRDSIAFGGTAPIRDYEANIELTYRAKVTESFTAQPALTLVRHPNGNAARNAVVGGVRLIWEF